MEDNLDDLDIRKTVVIFGISSFIGSNLAEYLKKYYRVVGTYYQTKVVIPGVLCLPCDISHKDSVQLILYSFRPEITIYAVGLTSVADCFEDDKLADKLNTVGVFNVATYSERYKSKLCYISSNMIFVGDDKEYGENDTPSPTTVYGKSKASAEFYIQKSCLNYLIFRCCTLYGRSYNPIQKTWMEVLESKLVKGESFICDNKFKTGFLDVYYLAIIFRLAIDKNVTNRLFQLTSKDLMTHYEFAHKYAEVFQLNASNVSKGNWFYPETAGGDFGSSIPKDGQRSFKMLTGNMENFFHFVLPTVEESLWLSYWRMGGTKGKAKKQGKSGLVQYI